MRESLGLLESGVDHRIVSMTDGVDANTASHIDNVVAVYVNEDCAFRALDIHRESCTNTCRNGVLAAFVKG